MTISAFRFRPGPVKALALACGLLAAASPGAEEARDPRPVLTVAFADTLVNPMDAFSLRRLFYELSSTLPQYRWKSVTISAAEGADGIRQAAPDFLIAPPGFALQYERLGFTKIATRKTSLAAVAERSVGAAFVVRDEPGAPNELRDLQGKRAGTALPTALDGWLAAAGEIAAQGFDAEHFFSEVLFRGNAYPDVLSALLAKKIDVAVLPACLLEAVTEMRLLDASGLRVVNRREGDLACAHSTALYPDVSFLALNRAPERAVRDATIAVLSSGERAAAASFLDRFEWVTNVSEAETLALMKTLRTGPYAYLRDMSPSALWSRWRSQILAGLLFVVLLFLNEVRLHRLVRKRTAELREALEQKERLEAESSEIRTRLFSFERRSIVQQMSGMVAHEINAPVGAVRTYATVLKLRLMHVAGVRDDKVVGEALAGIDREAVRIAGIVERVRGYAKARKNDQKPCSLVDVLGRSIRSWNAEGSDQQVTVTLHLPKGWKASPRPAPEDPDAVTGHPLELELLFLNLIRNAARASVKDAEALGKHRKAAVFVRLEAHGEKLRVRIENPGRDLSDEALEALRTISASVNSRPEGLGLGLTICRGIADAHGASLGFERLEGGGTVAVVEMDHLAGDPPAQ